MTNPVKRKDVVGIALLIFIVIAMWVYLLLVYKDINHAGPLLLLAVCLIAVAMLALGTPQ